ncbi:NAD(P)-binding protein [Lipomyces starkeyi]
MGSTAQDVPTLRWGVLGTGWISSTFTADLIAQRTNATAKHVITALGTSSYEKGAAFIDKVWKDSVARQPRIYDNYQAVYDDSDVDIVYVGTPHAMHKQNCLDAIAAGKAVLCEKPFTVNERDAQEVVDAAKAKGVYVMEAVWTRFFPLMQSLLDHLHVKKTIGDIHRCFVDLGLDMPLANLPADSRLKDPNLGAGALLEIGIYTLTHASLILGAGKVGDEHPRFNVISSVDITDGIDDSNVVVLSYEADKDAGLVTRTAICTSTFKFKSCSDFARIEGSLGTITISGYVAASPSEFRITSIGTDQVHEPKQQVYKFPQPEGTGGFVYEADAVALDIAAGRKENSTMPLNETLRMMRLMDGIRKEAGLIYPQD